MIFFSLGWVSAPYKVAALSIAAIACIAISNGGTTSQDLKTDYIVGATPSRQQIAILVGALSSALVLGFVILWLNDAGTVFAKRDYPQVTFATSEFQGREHLRGPDADRDHNEYNVVRLRDPRGPVPAGKYLVDDGGRIKYLEDPGINGQLTERDNGEKVKSKFSAPKPVLMSFIIEGIMTQKLPWGLVLIGVFISIVLELCGLSSLAFAVGVYLPVSTSTPIMVGGLVRWFVDRRQKGRSEAEADSGPGVLFSSGLIAGASVTGTILAMLQLSEPTRSFLRTINIGGHLGGFSTSDLVAFLLFLGVAAILYFVASERLLRSAPDGGSPAG
jgi:OPT oligopeptide transporter protein